MPVKRYICSKMLTVGISGAVSTLIPYLVLVVPVGLVMMHSTVPPYEGHTFVKIWQEMAVSYGDGVVYLLRGTLMVLFWILWSEVTLLLSLFVRNKYIAFVLPFILFELIWILFPVHTLNPVYLIRSDFDVDEMAPGCPFAVFLLYIVLVLVGIYFVFRRRIRNDKF